MRRIHDLVIIIVLVVLAILLVDFVIHVVVRALPH